MVALECTVLDADAEVCACLAFSEASICSATDTCTRTQHEILETQKLRNSETQKLRNSETSRKRRGVEAVVVVLRATLPLALAMRFTRTRTKLGGGAFGQVYVGYDRHTAQRVAIKVFHESKNGNYDTEDGSLSIETIREIECLRVLHRFAHPHLLKMVGADFQSENVVKAPIIALELKDECLRSYMLRHAPLKRDYAARVVHQIALGLAHLHALSYMHRDLKPENIMCDNAGEQFCVGDFGLVLTHRPERCNTLEVQTLWYRAPEVALGDSHYTFAIDVWSMALIHYELLGSGNSCCPADSAWDLLMLQFQLCGTPDESTWPGVSSLKYFETFWPRWKGRVRMRALSGCSPTDAERIMLLGMTLNPLARPTAAQYAVATADTANTANTVDDRTNIAADLARPNFLLQRNLVRAGPDPNAFSHSRKRAKINDEDEDTATTRKRESLHPPLFAQKRAELIIRMKIEGEWDHSCDLATFTSNSVQKVDLLREERLFFDKHMRAMTPPLLLPPTLSPLLPESASRPFFSAVVFKCAPPNITLSPQPKGLLEALGIV